MLNGAGVSSATLPTLNRAPTADALATLRFDRLQPAWDSLIESQLKILEKRGVPGLGTNKVERESDLGRGRIRKVLGMLEGVMEDS